MRTGAEFLLHFLPHFQQIGNQLCLIPLLAKHFLANTIEAGGQGVVTGDEPCPG